MKLLLHTNEAISRVRGEWREYQNRSLIVTYHPAYLLRDPTKKEPTWKDLQKIMKIYPFVF
jgi:DNA polymerase